MELFRLSARCEEKRCVHFDGEDCQLTVRPSVLTLDSNSSDLRKQVADAHLPRA